MTYLYLYGITFPTLVVIDLAWIVVVAQSFYKAQLGSMLSPTPLWWAAILFYLLYVAGLVFFAIAPAVEAHSVGRAALYGGFFALVAYATYDLTNLATTTNWPLLMTLVDLAWGTVAGAGISAIACTIAIAFGL